MDILNIKCALMNLGLFMDISNNTFETIFDNLFYSQQIIISDKSTMWKGIIIILKSPNVCTISSCISLKSLQEVSVNGVKYFEL